MLIKTITLLIVVFILSVPATVLAAEPGGGTIEGRIVNGTADGSSVADQQITLKTYLNDTEAGSSTVKTSAEGRFTFDNLSTGSGYSYQVAITYQEAEYSSERLVFDAVETTISIGMTVYDATTSDEAIKVTAAHAIIYIGEGDLKVVEFYLFANESDRTYIGSGEITATGTRRTLKLSLPDKITELQYGGELMECCVLNSEEGFTDTMAVLPGVKEIVYSYKVSYRSGAYTFSQKVNYPTASYNLLVQGEGSQITADRLTPNEPVDFEGTRFNYLSGQQFLSGDTVVAQLSGLPQTGNQWAVQWVVLTLVTLGGGLSLGYLLKKKRLQPVTSRGSLGQKRQRLLAELAQLDDDFEAGEIPKEVYRRSRTVKKTQLIELMQGLGVKRGEQW